MEKLRKGNDKLKTDLQSTKKLLENLSNLVTGKSQDGARLVVSTFTSVSKESLLTL